MSRQTRYWCDECREEMPTVKVQWSPYQENGYRLLDFCGYQCAEKFRQRVIDTGNPKAAP